MRLGFPQPCFWISTNPAYCSSRRVFTAFLPPTVEQGNYLADWDSTGKSARTRPPSRFSGTGLSGAG